MKVADLVVAWRQDAERLEHYGDGRGAELLRRVASDLEAATREHNEEALTLAQGASESGLSVDRLRHRIAEGSLPNAGRKGAPRVRRADLPVKRKQSTQGGFDAAAAARSILSAS